MQFDSGLLSIPHSNIRINKVIAKHPQIIAGRHSVKQTKMVEDHDDLYIKHKLPIQYCWPVHSTKGWKVSPHNLIQISSITTDISSPSY